MGMSDALGNVDFHSDYNSLSSQTKEAIEVEIRRLIEEGRLRATKLLTERRKELERRVVELEHDWGRRGPGDRTGLPGKT